MISGGGDGASTLTPFKPVKVLDIVFGVPYLQRQPKGRASKPPTQASYTQSFTQTKMGNPLQLTNHHPLYIIIPPADHNLV